MGVILQAVYRFPNGNTVPSPADGNRRIPWWWDHLASNAGLFPRGGVYGDSAASRAQDEQRSAARRGGLQRF